MPTWERDRIGPRRRRPFGTPAILIAVLLLVLAGGRTVASFVIDYQWWKEMGQLPTWFDMLLYGLTPKVAAGLAAFALFWIAHARGMKAAGERLRDYPLYARAVTVGALLLGFIVAAGAVDSWTVVRYFGGQSVASPSAEWQDPVFSKPLKFYLFTLPFYRMALRFVLAMSFLTGAIYWLTARGWELRRRLPEIGSSGEFDITELNWRGAFDSVLLRSAATVFLAGLALDFYLDRYDLLYAEHGFMVGVDFVNQNLTIPLLWLQALAAIAAIGLLWIRRLIPAIALMAAAVAIRMVVPGTVNAVWVRPNEISMQKPFIDRHIKATRSAFGLDHRTKEVEFAAKLETRIDPAKHGPLLDNVRLWDYRAFHDTVTQIQALRPYYRFADSDVDRYTIDGQLRQVLLTPRELDVRQLAEARTRWINQHFIYTHGYGVVLAEANRITPDGLPELFIYDAPPKVRAESLKLTRPELYYGEVTHEPVFVRTAQPEFNYPAGSENVHSKYEGKSGIQIASPLTRLAAAVAEGDWNILLTSYVTPESRMLIRRRVTDRVAALAGFLSWDADPYLVLTNEGRLVWMIDGFTTSAVHPYAQSIRITGIGRLNYMRNAVKATVDAYDGETRLYIFDAADPIIQAYSRLFPQLLKPASEMPADLRAHARYPEMLFRAQAEVYRTFHMRDPESFYNKEDLWDIARNLNSPSGKPEPAEPTFVMATLSGEKQAEFLLILPFTPRNKDNLIGLMVARCDGEHLGELRFLQLSKQALVFGPMQIEARINQDQNIAKDLSLWNQQGSQVLRGQMLVLPVEETFLYVEPIYIQASEARMPQLKKVAMAMGNALIYTDTYEQAVAELARLRPGGTAEPVKAAAVAEGPPPPAGAPVKPSTPAGQIDPRIERIRQHLRRYRELNAQGKWAEAGRELEALEGVVR